MILTHFALEESLSAEDRERSRHSIAARMRISEHLTNAPLVAVLSVGFVARFAFGMLIGTFALFAERILFAGADFAAVSLGVGLMLMGVGVGQLLTQVILLPVALNRVSDSTVVLIGCSARATSLFVLAIAVEPLFGTVGIILFSVGSGLLLPSLQSITNENCCTRIARRHSRALPIRAKPRGYLLYRDRGYYFCAESDAAQLAGRISVLFGL